MRTKTVVLGVLSVFILSVSLLAQVTPAQRTDIEKTLTAATKEILDSFSQLHQDTWAKYASADFQEYVGGGNIGSKGKEATLKTFTDMASYRASQKIDPDVIKVYVISPDSAYVLTICGLSLVLKDGRHGGFGLASTAIWRKETGGWKMIHMHESAW
jgi:hypothetical protein